MQRFGVLKTMFNNLMIESISSKNEQNKKLFREYVNAVKSDKVLRDQFLVYNNIENKCEVNESKANNFVMANIDSLNIYTKKELEEANQKLVNILEGVEISVEESEIYKNISDIIYTETTLDNIENRLDLIESVKNYVINNDVKSMVKENTELVPNSMLLNISVEKFNDKYSELSESVKSVLKTIIESDDDGKINLLKNLKKECLSLVNEHLNETSNSDIKNALLDTKERILDLEYTNESFIADINRLITLKEDLSE